MGAFFSTVSHQLQSLRGRAEKFVGDAVMAVWGLPHLHEDDALRAVRTGFAVREAAGRLGESLGLPEPLQVRAGVNTGPVAIGSGPADQFLVSGATVNMAARLQQAADPGQILVGETTWQLTQHAVEFGEQRRVPAKGFGEDVPAWEALAISRRSSRRTIPLVDRRRELAMVSAAFERVRDTSRAHLVTVLGEPGIGKSRLVDEFVAGLPEEVKVLSGAATDFEEDITFAPLAEMVLRELGAERDSPAAMVRQRLHEIVEACCEPSEVDRVAARLAELLDLGVERGADGGRAADDGTSERYAEAGSRDGDRYRTAEVRAGMVRLLHGFVRSGPVVMILEDLQLAKDELLDLIEELYRQCRRIPLFVIAVARDGLMEVRPGWGGGVTDALTLRLEPLAPEEARELAAAAGGDLDPSTAARVAGQAGGNPFFIIETTGMLVQEHPEHRAGVLHSHVLPPTVQAVVASRIDHLSEPARDLLRKASVFARSSFSAGELRLIAEPREDLLAELEGEEFVVREPDRPGVWRFRHEMLRDVAYESVPKRDRMRLHVRVADGLEGSTEAGRYPQVVAHHLAQAAEASLDLEPGDRTLPERAIKALGRAGDAARRRMESRTAIELYEKALRLAGPETGWGIREARLLAGMGEARYWLGEFDRADADLRRALAAGDGDAWARTHAMRFLGDVVLNVRGDPDEADVLFDGALAAAKELGDPFAMARTLLMAGWAPYWRSDLARSRQMWEEALSIARSNPEGDRWAEARALVALVSVVSPAGDAQEALPLGEEALRIGGEMGDPFTVAVASETLGNALLRMLRTDEAGPHIEEAVRIFRDLGARWELASALGERGELAWLTGRFAAAEADFQEAFEICVQLGERSLISWTAAELALVLLGRGRASEARRLLDDDRVVGVTGEPGAEAIVVMARVAVDLADGNRALAEDQVPGLREEALRDRATGFENGAASRLWWLGRLFGPEAAGGEDELRAARERLERVHWHRALREPDLLLMAIGGTARWPAEDAVVPG
jgi:tetratricopeptide (TPR) repeat protein